LNRLEANREPEAGAVIEPLPTRKFFMYVSPAETDPLCILLLSVGVYHRKFGGVAEFAAAMKLDGLTELLTNIFPLLNVLE
jgi:hypothetical protein